MKTLIIDGTGRDETKSRTKYLANRVIKQMNLANVEQLDLYNMELPFVTTEIMADWKTDRTETQAMRLLNQFEQADHVIFIYPTWNWSVPAIIRVYMDLVLISGRTFGYNSKGKKVGYLTNKKATLISTTGGKSYPRVIASLLGSQDGDNYMKQVLNTMGITNITAYSIDNTAYNYNDETGKFSQKKYSKKVEQIVNKVK